MVTGMQGSRSYFKNQKQNKEKGNLLLKTRNLILASKVRVLQKQEDGIDDQSEL